LTQYAEARWSWFGTITKAITYNAVISPTLYELATKLPFLGLGETRLERLPSVERLPRVWVELAARQLLLRAESEVHRQRRTAALCEMALRIGFQVPQDALRTASIVGLNRLPLLCRDPEQAKWIVRRAGQLGVSAMYEKTLPEFLGKEPSEVAVSHPNTFAFSRRLITLPTHSRVSDADRRMVEQTLRDAR
jgi:dTDP-4-amino-4,6-dideoxygalactose transaminase